MSRAVWQSEPVCAQALVTGSKTGGAGGVGALIAVGVGVTGWDVLVGVAVLVGAGLGAA